MHSLIVSNVHQEPLFTAEQVIKEIEDMLEVVASSHALFNQIVGERSFQSAVASMWNAVPRSVHSSASVFQSRSRLKTELFARSCQQSY